MLLTRDNFRDSVFKRDKNKCVVCSAPAKDAHHLIERRLFADGGYYLDNGVSLCSEHHLMAEKTIISVSELRNLAKIKTKILPRGYSNNIEYDKWGNIILDNGLRIAGPLFNDESVQKILKAANKLYLFTIFSD